MHTYFGTIDAAITLADGRVGSTLTLYKLMSTPAAFAPGQLIVGGHSFIPELGNDPALDSDSQLDLVDSCINAGISSFDTTYEAERIALGAILATLKRRDEACIIAWNFFSDRATGDYLVPPRAYQQSDIDVLCSQLQAEYIDLLVVHPVESQSDNERQIDVARTWLAAGHVRALGVWAPGPIPQERFKPHNAFKFMVTPRNIAEPNDEAFQAGKQMGWRTFATSPFGRGWLLDKLLAIAAARDSSPEHASDQHTLRTKLADAMLRFSLHAPYVDHLIVGIRKERWIQQNLESAQRGPLEKPERDWLLGLFAQL
jgi:aryl-alcohol dehydrogenase-like predicted oxidoreductase